MRRVMSKEEIALRRKLLFRLVAAPNRFGDSGRMQISDPVDPALLDVAPLGRADVDTASFD